MFYSNVRRSGQIIQHIISLGSTGDRTPLVGVEVIIPIMVPEGTRGESKKVYNIMAARSRRELWNAIPGSWLLGVTVALQERLIGKLDELRTWKSSTTIQ